MKKIEVLCWGMEHIAQNHNFKAVTDYEETHGEVCIYGGCNVPTLGDVESLCEDLGLPRQNIETSDFGIDVWLDDWNGEEEYTVTGHELWKRYDSVIGS
jgi:hypothetical protein